MALRLKDVVLSILQSNVNTRLTANELANLAVEKRPFEYNQKKQSSRAISTEAELRQQLAAEIGSSRPNWRRTHPELKTTEGRPRRYYYSSQATDKTLALPQPRAHCLYPLSAVHNLSEFDVDSSNKCGVKSDWSGTVRPALLADLDALVPPFEGCRAFYGPPANAAGTWQFLLDRFKFNQSTVFLAEDSLHTAVGFAQLYPFFTSVGLAQVLVLNDLFVAESHRGTGAVTQLMESIRTHEQSCGAANLRLSTAVTNQRAERVYERAA